MIFQNTCVLKKLFSKMTVFERTVMHFSAAGCWGTSIIIQSKLRTHFRKGLLPLRHLRCAGGRRGQRNPISPAQRNAGHPDPPPACVILHLISGCPSTRMSRNRAQDDAGWGVVGLGGGLHCRGRLYKRHWLCTKDRQPFCLTHRSARCPGLRPPNPCERWGEVGLKGCNQPPIPESTVRRCG